MADFQEIQAARATHEDGVVLTIYRPDGEPYTYANGDGNVTPCTVTVLGPEAQKVRQAQDAVTRRLMRRRRVKLDPDDLRVNRIAVASSAIVAWHGWEKDGQVVDCSPEHVREFLQYDHILEQVEAGMQEHADFLLKRSTNSAPPSDTTQG